jgi:hypothetical protein
LEKKKKKRKEKKANARKYVHCRDELALRRLDCGPPNEVDNPTL